MRYATIEGGNIVRVGPHPGWRNDEGALASDAELRPHGVLPVIEAVPECNHETHSLVELPYSEWVVGDEAVTAAWSVVARSPEDVQARRVQGVLRERERRLAAGFDYDFGDGRGVHRIGTTKDDMEKWTSEVTPIANTLVAKGMGSTEIRIFTDTGPVSVTADEWLDILLAAASFRQPIYTASFVLLLMDPIPADYADDAYWQPAP